MYMKKIFLLFLLVVGFAGCGAQDEVVVEGISENISLERISLEDVDEISVKVGQVMYFGYEYWPSVGNDADYEIDDEDIVGILEEDTYTPSMPEGFTGGDSGFGTFYFIAKKAGKTSITVRNLFRGDVEEEREIEVVVE